MTVPGPGSPDAGPDETTFDVVVVGAGLAGNAAALTAAEAGATVCLLEKGEAYGGTSVKAGGGLVFAGTDLQDEAGVRDDAEGLRTAIMDAGRGRSDPDTVEAYLDHQLDTYRWMSERGVAFDYFPDLVPRRLNRLHGTAPGHATEVLHRCSLAHPGVRYRVRTRGKRLVRGADGVVGGIVVESDGTEAVLTARRGVVLASGGFVRSDDLVATFAPEWLLTTRMGGTANTGDGLRMAWALGAAVADMAYVEASFGASIPNFPDVADTPGVEPTLLYPNSQGAVVVNREARRFADETLPYKELSAICVQQPDGIAFMVFDAAVMDRSLPTPSPADFSTALADGRLVEADTLEGLAEKVGLSPDALVSTIRRYNGHVDAGNDPDFGRPVDGSPASGGGRIDTGPFYAYPCRCGLTTTYCGLRVDRSLRVVDVFGEPIEGLFAAGEVVGGFHGAGYYSGTGLGKAAVFGRGAGLAAAERRPRTTS
ncbi:FAD-dependent oxidoreductase [Pseudonocardia pini]|uniref:FAD-dependent oxidoreductase n=1 Tax=Pseudonocardia pini TaxID=2758030 RepID=UPI0015F02583|nr:FAD-binding protein [Pseudonocardia pini]